MAEPKQTGCLHKQGQGICGKLVAEIGCRYCPRHLLLAEQEQNKMAELGRRSGRARQFQAQQRETLAASPLAALNPNYRERR